MEKQRDKQARRMQRKLARQSGAVDAEGNPIEDANMDDVSLEGDAEPESPEAGNTGDTGA